jgi:hypothetical protein
MFGSTIIEIGGRIVQNAGAFQLLIGSERGFSKQYHMGHNLN